MSGTLIVFGTNSSDASGALEMQESERILQSQREKGRGHSRDCQTVVEP